MNKKKKQEMMAEGTELRPLKIIATTAAVPFQGVPLPYTPENEEQIQDLKEAIDTDTPIVLVPVVNPHLRISADNLLKYGVLMKVVRMIDLPEEKMNAFLIGEQRMEIREIQTQTGSTTFIGTAIPSEDELPSASAKRFKTAMEVLTRDYDFVKDYISEMSQVTMAPPSELKEDRKTYLNFIIITSPFDFEERAAMLEERMLTERAELAIIALDKVKRQIQLRKKIYARAMGDINREQRDHFLRAQIRQIQSEMGEGDDDIAILEEKAANKAWSEKTAKTFAKELGKLRRFAPNTPDYAMQYNYLETLLSLPWDNVTDGDIDLNKLQKDLDRDHYGLEDIKERIMEHIAVIKLRDDMRAPILCIYGPPGVGKTSLCRSIAESLGRDYARISLGGLHDETQIRGHRRTYVGALPGRIIGALQDVESNNPVFVLDEIDKIGSDHRGDPAQALLEVLDPEQNSKFHDNYLDTDYDLSKILFIATANSLSGISAPLLDRMELIEAGGYIPQEKTEIAKRHLIPKQLEAHGFRKGEIKIGDDAIELMIDSYTRESGVRKLEKTIAKLLRKIAVKKAKGEKYPKTIGRKKALELLGREELAPQAYENDLPAGVAAGLAWTSAGGEILYFETSLSKGKGELTLTGQLGDVMRESATIALKWIKANAESLGIDPERFATTDIHLHVPEGAVPKDGPSAGITMTTSMVSALTGRRVKDRLAMTGEATLSGRVLPVGGVKEKILAAKRAGISEIVLSEKNRKDIEAIKAEYISGVNFHYVKTIGEVMAAALG